MQDYCVIITDAETGIPVWDVTQEMDDSDPMLFSAELRAELKYYALRVAENPAREVNGWGVTFDTQINDGAELSNEVPRGTLTIVAENGDVADYGWRAERV